jgi:hypothetical protein
MIPDSIPQFIPMPHHRAAFPIPRIASLPPREAGMKFDAVQPQAFKHARSVTYRDTTTLYPASGAILSNQQGTPSRASLYCQFFSAKNGGNRKYTYNITCKLFNRQRPAAKLLGHNKHGQSDANRHDDGHYQALLPGSDPLEVDIAFMALASRYGFSTESIGSFQQFYTELIIAGRASCLKIIGKTHWIASLWMKKFA